jgi:hypothetical protein
VGVLIAGEMNVARTARVGPQAALPKVVGRNAFQKLEFAFYFLYSMSCLGISACDFVYSMPKILTYSKNLNVSNIHD